MSIVEKSTGKRLRSQAWTRPVLVVALLLSVALYLFQSPVSAGGFYSRAPNGFYGLLTDALMSGQTHLKLEPDPALLQLENPWAGNQGIVRLHDATYYNGKYYLYFSPIPALLAGIPWRLATHTFLSDGALTTFSALLVLFLGFTLIFRCWRLWFTDLSPVWLLGGLATFSLANAQLHLISTNSVYPVPIAAAIACKMGALLALIRSLRATDSRTRLIALASASLLWGIVVACRPNHLLTLPALGLVSLWLIIRGIRETGFLFWPIVKLGAAALVPAGLVGLALASYNYIRFGDVAEFGLTYQFAAGDQRVIQIVEWRNLIPNLRIYLFSPFQYSPYFPFITPSSEGSGILLRAPLLLLILAWPLTLFIPNLRNCRVWAAIGISLLLDFCLSLGSVSLLPTANERYQADFLPSAILLAVFTALALARWSHTRRRGGWIARVLMIMLLVGTIGHSLLLACADNGRPERLHHVALVLNRITAAVEKAQGKEFGPISCTVQFSRGEIGRREALISSGAGRDTLFIWHTAENEISVGFDHLGAGGPLSEPITVDYDRPYELLIDLGCLYPPAAHPRFSASPPSQVRVLQRRLRVVLDGRVLLNTGSHFYPTHPGDLQIGTASMPAAALNRFSGRISSLTRHGIPAPDVFLDHGAIGGALRLSLSFPEFVNFKSEPLISTGHLNAGDLLYVSYVAPGKLRFGHDSWHAGSIETNLVDYTAGAEHVLEVDLPSLYFSTNDAAVGRLVLKFDGAVLMADERPYHPSLSSELVLGFNGSDSSAARMNFSGRIHRSEVIAPLALPELEFQSASGPVRMVLKFPTHRNGSSEPLLVTGRNGAGDVIFVQYVDDSHIRVGFDHWSMGGPTSAPILIDYASTHTVEISMSSLYPPGAGPVPETVLIKLNGRTVLEHPARAYPTRPSEVMVGKNTIGASSCERLFSGKIFFHERQMAEPSRED